MIRTPRSLRTRTSLGIAGAVLAGGAVTGTALVTDTATAPVAAASELPAYADCGALLADLHKRAVRQVGPYGWKFEGPIMYAQGVTEDTAAGTASARASQAASATGTNTQEVGVDEPDTAKTDGDVVVRIRGRALEVYDVTGATPRLLSTSTLPRNIGDAELLLVGSDADRRVVVVGSVDTVNPLAIDDTSADSLTPRLPDPSTRLLTYSLADPADPTIVEDQSIDGTDVSVRQYADTVRLVTNTGLPQLAFEQPRQGRTEKESTAANRALVLKTTIEDWLPTLRDNRTGASEPLVACTDVRRPAAYAGLDRLAVTALHPGRDDHRSIAVLASGETAYSSESRLYVVTQRWTESGWGRVPLIGRVMPSNPRPDTSIHEFALDGLDTSYQASTTIRASIRDRWSLDEHDGVLRAVVSWPGRNGETAESGILTFRPTGERLVQLGSVKGLGHNEQVQSVRFFDDLAIVVTFRQMDPLYTVDLSDPAHPKTLGELKIPGFSAYLHPIGGDRLLGLGTAADNQGRGQGSQASVFDIEDLAAPDQLDVLRFGKDTYFGAAEDPHAFTWVPDANAAITTMQDWSTGRGTVVRLDVAADGTLTKTDLGRSDDYDNRTLPLGGDRVALVGRTVQLLDL